MASFFYGASAPVFDASLKSLSQVLEKGERDAAERKYDPTILLSSRLAPDMLPLMAQVRIATDHAKGATARLAGKEIMRVEDNETSFAELQARIAHVREHLATYGEADFDGAEERQITMKLRGREMIFSAHQYFFRFAQPNFYFHITTAYAILRHNGVPLGKADFIGAV